jgi:hypothetical protein
MDKRYRGYLHTQLLCSIGVGRELAERLKAEHAGVVKRFAEVATEMMGLRNPGSVDAGSTVGERVSVLDVFRVFQTLPRAYFEDPEAEHSDQIIAAAEPIYRGNRFHIAKRKARAESLIKELDRVYCEIMRACESHAEQYYGDLSSMRSSIVSRATFENEPMNLLYYADLNDSLARATAAYESTGDSAVLHKVMNEKISPSLRSFEMLLVQGSSRRIGDGGYEVEMRTIDGINYSLRVWDDEMQTRLLRVSMPVDRLTNSPVVGLTRRQIKSLRYRFTTDGWVSSDEVGSRLARDTTGRRVVWFHDICKLPTVGHLVGTFIVAESNGLTERCLPFLGGYTFVVPNRQELMRLIRLVESQ